jgi:hypothetical protein
MLGGDLDAAVLNVRSAQGAEPAFEGTGVPSWWRRFGVDADGLGTSRQSDGPFQLLDAPTESLRLSSQRGEFGFVSRGSRLSPFRSLGLRYSGIRQQLAFDNASIPDALGTFDHSRRPRPV